MIYTAHYSSPLGELLLAGQDSALVGLWIEGQKYYPDTMGDRSTEQNDLPIFTQTRQWLDRYFSGHRPPIEELQLAPIGSAFRQAVWRILCEIPYGAVTTYREIAKTFAARRGLETMSAQAVGGAVAHNPISIIIPCHRVVGTSDSLTGYAGGIERKIQLLKLEGVDMTDLFVPKGAAK